jgi:AGCS family alanine or glycine:cation symporter
MDPQPLTPILEMVWIWIAAPLTAVAAVVLTVRLKLPQILGLPAAFRGLRQHDEGAEGTGRPATAVAMATVATYGAAAAVGAATAVSLGGAGAIAWVWLFSFLLMPLRMGEALLARTAPPGRAGDVSGTLAGRLLDDDVGGLRAIGYALLVLVPLTGFAFYGGTHGEAVIEAAEELLPGSALPLGVGVAVVGGLVALAPMKRAGSAIGWVAAVSLIALFGAALVALFSSPGRGFSGIGRAFLDAMYDAPSVGSFSGALAGEIALAGLLHLLPPLVGVAGVDGAWQAQAQAETTKAQASAALLGPLFYGILTTVIGLSLIATNAFSQPIEDTRPLGELTFYGVDFDTVSQRQEPERLFTGFIRVEDGTTGVIETHVGSERGMVRSPVFEDAGAPGNFALHVTDGHIDSLQKPGMLGALELRPPSEIDRIIVRGDMLPSGGRLLAASMTRGGGAVTSRVALAALLLLAALGAAAWGLGVQKTLAARLPRKIARAAAILPAIGLGVAASGVVPGLGRAGTIIAGLLAAASAIALIVRAKDAAGLLKKK